MTDLLNSSNISSNFTEDMIDLSSLADLSNMTDPSNGTMEYFCFGHVTKTEAYYIFLVREFTCSMYRLWSKCLHGRVHSQSHMKYIVVPFSPTPLVLFIRPLPSSSLTPLSSSLLPSPLSSPLLPSSPLSFPLLPSPFLFSPLLPSPLSSPLLPSSPLFSPLLSSSPLSTPSVHHSGFVVPLDFLQSDNFQISPDCLGHT